MRYFAFPADIQIFLLFFPFLMKKLSLCWAFVFFLMDWLPAAQAQTPDRTVTGQVPDGANR